MSKKPPPSVWESLGALAGIGFVIAVPIALGVILGSYLDHRLNTGHLFLLLGLLLGLISGFYGAYRLISRVF